MRDKNNIKNKERAATAIRENEKQERGKEQHNAISLNKCVISFKNQNIGIRLRFFFSNKKKSVFSVRIKIDRVC